MHVSQLYPYSSIVPTLLFCLNHSAIMITGLSASYSNCIHTTIDSSKMTPATNFVKTTVVAETTAAKHIVEPREVAVKSTKAETEAKAKAQ